MFKKTRSESQLGIFANANSFLSGRAVNLYENPDAWHNLFRTQVTTRIDESICKPLFTEQTGAPNSPVRVLIAMMILKEANGWSDEQLFEQCRFNLLVRSALGLINTDDAVPTESTYYLFRKRIVEYEKTKKVNLFETIFASVTTAQAADFQVSGKSIRMDSKLLGSNIAWLSRYELIHETLRLFCRDAKVSLMNHPLLTEDKGLIESLLKEKGNKVVYRSTGDEVKTKMQQLGVLAYKLIELFNSSYSHYVTLTRLFSEQFFVDEHKMIITRSKEEISSHSIQSPHDTDSHYRNKDGNQVKGYSINITESCDKDTLNLIGDVDVRVVSASDNDFVQDGITGVKEIFTDPIENVHADGAYHSPENQQFCESENMNLLINAIQGAKGRYDLSLNEANELTVVDTVTNEIIAAIKTKNQDKWRIKVGAKYKYFTTEAITASALKRKIAAIPQEILNIRNNVEATIFQVGYHYPNDKSRYRGLIKHKMWTHIRCLWVNFVRIANYLTKPLMKNPFCPHPALMMTLVMHILAAITNLKLLFCQTNSMTTKNQLF